MWPGDRRRRSPEPPADIKQGPRGATGQSSQSSSLGKAIYLYDELLNSVKSKLSGPNCASLDLTLSSVRRQLPEDIRVFAENARRPQAQSLPGERKPGAEGIGYLGQTSDTWVFNIAKEFLHDDEPSRSPIENAIHSYDRGAPPLHRGMLTELPTREAADAYVDIYFFTIHIAYPFVSRRSFLAQYEEFWADGKGDDAWLSLLCKFGFISKKTLFSLCLQDTIFSIGAYYSSFPHSRDGESQTHLGYFEQAVSVGDSILTDCTLGQAQALMAQCFFLLATGQIDR